MLQMDGHVAGQVHQQIDLTSNDDKSLVKEIKWETNRNGYYYLPQIVHTSHYHQNVTTKAPKWPNNRSNN